MAGSWAAIAAKGASVPAPAPVSSANIKASLEDTGTANKTSASTAGPPVLSEQEEALRSVKKVVLDSGAIIKGGRLESLGQKFWTIKEVLGEVKDSHARAGVRRMRQRASSKTLSTQASACFFNSSSHASA